ncbi:MAG: hypothetical protein GYB68_19955 [Chloroflexi bacterium]|nr:hypothetical protein [Chloroflexota bacterium]
MTVVIDERNADRIIVIRYDPPFDPAQDARIAIEAVLTFKQHIGDRCAVIWNLEGHQMDFSTVVQGMGEVGRVVPSFFDQLVPILVGDDFISQTITEAVNEQPQYNIASLGVSILLEPNLEQALKTAQIRLSSQEPA